MVEVNYEKLWEEIEEAARKESTRPPAWAKSTRELMNSSGLARGAFRGFLDRMIRDKKVKFWGKYNNANYYVPYSADDGI